MALIYQAGDRVQRTIRDMYRMNKRAQKTGEYVPEFGIFVRYTTKQPRYGRKNVDYDHCFVEWLIPSFPHTTPARKTALNRIEPHGTKR